MVLGQMVQVGVKPVYQNIEHCSLSHTPIHTFIAEGSDYSVVSPTTVTFESVTTVNGQMRCLDILITNDDAYEQNELFTFQINAVNPTSAAMIGTDAQATKTIQDDEGTCVTMKGLYGMFTMDH